MEQGRPRDAEQDNPHRSVAVMALKDEGKRV